jgi:hypothetical protein
MQTRIKKEITVRCGDWYTPQWRKAWYLEWKGFYIYVDSNNMIQSSYPCKYISNCVDQLETAQKVIDNFLKNPITKTQVEYIKYP